MFSSFLTGSDELLSFLSDSCFEIFEIVCDLISQLSRLTGLRLLCR